MRRHRQVETCITISDLSMHTVNCAFRCFRKSGGRSPTSGFTNCIAGLRVNASRFTDGRTNGRPSWW